MDAHKAFCQLDAHNQQTLIDVAERQAALKQHPGWKDLEQTAQALMRSKFPKSSNMVTEDGLRKSIADVAFIEALQFILDLPDKSADAAVKYRELREKVSVSG